jgi:outer membrane protein OmpA-like peptidoglycan-associated protein
MMIAAAPPSTLSLPTTPIDLPVAAIDGSMMITRTRVTLQSDVLFAFDSAKLSAQARDRIADAADAIERHNPHGVRVEGFTDSRGTSDYNMRLSHRRATAVQRTLAEDLGRLRIAAVGRGETAPIASNATARGRELNRRVEIRFR